MVRRSTAAAASRKKTTKVDFTGVEAGPKRIPEGDYVVEVGEVTQEVGDKADYFKWKFAVADGKHKGATLYNNTSLAPQSLWALRNLLECLGVEVPDGAMDIDLSEYVGLKCGATVADDEYEGKIKSRITDFFALDDGDEEQPPEEEEPKKPAGRAGKGAKAPKLEKLKSDEVAEMDEDELTSVVEKYSLDLDLDEHKSLRRKANAVLDALEAKGFLEEE